MAYKMYARPLDMLKEIVLGGERHETFWALRDIDLVVNEGDRVGIVGPNGAGKSTLLKIIAGNLTATSGRVEVHGRVSSLLSMVPAWNEEQTGIENVRFNLLVKGIPDKKIAAVTDEIIDFTELGPFIFHPVRTYSTGMSARLSFAIATATEPEILIIDEVLGTGDGYFAWKAYKRMQEFCARGRALLFVSHSLSAVQQMCDKAVWLQNGTVRHQGEASYVLRQYELDFRKAEDEELRARQTVAPNARGAMPSPDELVEPNQMRFRIMPKAYGRFFSTHYICSISVSGLQPKSAELPLEFTDLNSPNVSGTLDVLSSEWGRIHERDGRLCRILSHATGRNPGGQFVVRADPIVGCTAADFEVEIVAASTDRREILALDMLDLRAGSWSPLTPAGASSAGGDWQRLRFRGNYQTVEMEKAKEIEAAVVEASHPDAEILELKLVCDGETAFVVKERQSFEIHARIRFNRSPPLVDVGIKLTRIDGVYVFWQSSGMMGGNLMSPTGERTVRFIFSENLLGAGEYFVNGTISNGWNYPENYPYSRILARVINGLSFRVAPEFADLDLGVINQRVPVTIV